MTQASQAGQPRFIDLSARAKFRLTGADRFRFVNGQITNDLRKASETNAIEACVLNAKGKMDAHIIVSAFGESFLIDGDSTCRDNLRVRLERYIIADDVEIEDVTDRFSIFHVLSQESPSAGLGRVVSVQRFAEPGWDIWSDADNHDALRQQLGASFLHLDSAAAEVLRIEQGIPRWGFELTEEIIPVEANLEQRTIDYQKGCYIGQEVISRMKMSGQTNKRLCGLLSLDNVALHPGAKLVAPSGDAKQVGWITSATRSERQEIALGYVKRGFNSVGTKLHSLASDSATQPDTAIAVVSIPFL